MSTKTICGIFNLDELEKNWEDGFYEGNWGIDTMNLTDLESEIVDALGDFLPRHMPVYDWNLPYAEEIVLIVRRAIAKYNNGVEPCRG